MPLLPDISQRRLQPELIDQPQLDETQHHRALEGLARINFWSRSARILWPAICALARQEQARPLRLLDIASGAGDVPISLWHKARRAGFALHVDGCDVSPRAVAHARERAERSVAQVGFFEADALSGQLPRDYDIVTSSLFLHHLTDDNACALLKRMPSAARRVMLVNDLVRSRAGFLLATVATRALTRSKVVHNDAPISVEGAFSLDEVRGMCRRAGLENATIQRRWPCRFLLSWSRPTNWTG